MANKVLKDITFHIQILCDEDFDEQELCVGIASKDAPDNCLLASTDKFEVVDYLRIEDVSVYMPKSEEG